MFPHSFRMHHETTAFPGFGTKPPPGPFVYFLPTEQICGPHKHFSQPAVQIVQPAGVGRYMGVPKTTAAYLTSASCGGIEASLALDLVIGRRTHVRDFI
jgi:hypothetical protein